MLSLGLGLKAKIVGLALETQVLDLSLTTQGLGFELETQAGVVAKYIFFFNTINSCL